MSLSDWESDLTELETSSDEDYVPKRKRGRPLGSTSKAEYKVRMEVELDIAGSQLGQHRLPTF